MADDTPPTARAVVDAHLPSPADEPPAGESDRPRKSVTTALVELAEQHYRVLLSEDGAPYAVELTGPNLAIPLRGRDGLRQRLARLYYAETKTAAAGAALADALAVLEGAATAEGREPVALRLARDDDETIVLDLGRPDGRCAIIKPGEWHVADRSPILFRRSALTGEMALPVKGGDVEQLLAALVNAKPTMVRLIVAWLVAALIPDMPHPILGVFGEQGTAKTTLMRLLAMLVDPSPAPTRTAPRDIGQWAVTASASWVVALDNVSTIPEWLSDALCRAVTGDGLTSRALYSDADVSVLTFRRVIAMTSIDAGSLRGDLGERLLPIELEVIDPTARKTDAQITSAFAGAAPALLGALLDLLARVLTELPKVRTTVLPRMADFARVLHALDTVAKWSTAGDYAGTAADVAETVIDSDPFAVAVRNLVPMPGQPSDPASEWKGTASDLLGKITPERPPRGWPGSPRAVSGAIKRITPALRAVGVTVAHDRQAGGSRTRLITFTGPAHDANLGRPSQPSQPSRDGADQQQRRDGSRDGSGDVADTGGTVATGAVQPSRQPSHPDQPAEQQEHPLRDGRDGWDGCAPQDSSGGEPRPGCARCGAPLLLITPSRTICARCETQDRRPA